MNLTSSRHVRLCILLMVLACMCIISRLSTPTMTHAFGNSFNNSAIGHNLVNWVVPPECIDCIQVNKSISIKGFGSFRFPEPNCHGKLLVYECLDGELCGGLADRQKGIMSSFLLALLTNRTFVLNHRKSCDMKKMMPPRVYNWFKCTPYVFWYNYKGQHTVRYIDAKGNLPNNFSILPSGDIWKEHTVKLHVNTRLNMAIKGHPDARKMLPWLFNASDREVISGLMKVLLKPEETLKHHVDNFIKKHTAGGRKELVGVHIRSAFLDKDRDLPVYFQALTQYNDTNNYAIYFATDDDEIRREAEQKFANFVSLNTNIVHIDRVDDACEGMYTAIFEQQILANADILFLSHSGFSRLAASIRDSSENLFLYVYKTATVDAHFEKVRLEDVVGMYPTS